MGDLLKIVEPRKEYFKKYSKSLFHLIAINVGFLLFRAIIVLLNKFGYKPNTSSNDDNPFGFLIWKFIEVFPPFRYVIIVFVSWLIGLMIVPWIFDKVELLLESVYPSIEFDFGPEFFRKPRKHRKAIATLFTLIVLPLLLQILLLILN